MLRTIAEVVFLLFLALCLCLFTSRADRREMLDAAWW